MKKKTDPQHYLTDALITSDEWDSFDYNLQLEIKELGQIDYNGTSLDWKKNTLAFGYLWQAEKLLLEKGEIRGHAIENIRELKTLIKKYDHLKTFLLTLRLATTVYRAGLIPEFVTEGNGFLNRQSHAGKQPRSHDGKTPAELQIRNNQIIEHFKKTHLSLSNFADKHAAKYGIKSRTIRLILSKTVGN